MAAQVVEDEGALHAPRGQGTYHAYNAALKRVLGNKGRAEMTLPELEAAVSWLERNRLSDHLHLLAGDHRYDWAARQRQDWRPPVGRPATRRPVREAARGEPGREDAAPARQTGRKQA